MSIPTSILSFFQGCRLVADKQNTTVTHEVHGSCVPCWNAGSLVIFTEIPHADDREPF